MRTENFIVLYLAALHLVTADDSVNPTIGDCVFNKHTSYHSSMETLKKLSGKRYSVKDDVGTYIYEVGICTPGLPSTDSDYEDFKTSGAVQRDLDEKHKTHNIGSVQKAEIMGGSNWLSLEYEGGENYHSSCGNEGKRTIIMITCGSSDLTLIEENKNKTGDCYYMFELQDEAVCPTPSHGLSVGSILVIIFVLVVSLYVVGGFIYQRFIAGAKGLEQMPNYSFWRDFGNLQADGCDLICRSGDRQSRNKQYRGIGDDQLQSHEEEFEPERDEHLLPM